MNDKTKDATGGERPVSPMQEIRSNLLKLAPQFQALMPTQEHVERFVRVITTAIQDKPELLECDRNSLYAAAMKCAQDGLLPDGKEAHLNVRNTNVGTQQAAKWVKLAAYEPMVEGLLKKFRNSGACKGTPNVQVVREGDLVPPARFDYQLGDDAKIVHVPALTNRGNVIGAYSIVHLKDGGVSREYMGIDEILEVRDISKAKDSGPWKIGKDGKHGTIFGEQCRKTVFRRHYKKLPRSTDLDNVLKTDDEQYVFEDQRASTLNDIGAHVEQQAQQQQRTPSGRRRPKALAAIAEAGGTPTPTTTPKQEQKEPATIEGDAKRETDQQQQQGDGPRADVI